MKIIIISIVFVGLLIYSITLILYSFIKSSDIISNLKTFDYKYIKTFIKSHKEYFLIDRNLNPGKYKDLKIYYEEDNFTAFYKELFELIKKYLFYVLFDFVSLIFVIPILFFHFIFYRIGKFIFKFIKLIIG